MLTFIRSHQAELVICDDFNIDLLSKSTSAIRLGRLMKQFGATQLIKSPTRIATVKYGNGMKTSKTLIDHFYASKTDYFMESGSIPFSSTDHNLIYLLNKKLKIKMPPKILEYRCYKNIVEEDFIHDLDKMDWSFLSHEAITKNSPVMFETLVLALVDKHAPVKKKIIKGLLAPWVSSEIFGECSERDRLKKSSFSDETVLSEYKKQRNKVNQMLSDSKKSYFNNKFARVKTSSDVWSVMNEIINFRSKSISKIPKLILNDNNTTTDDNTICEQFANEFIVRQSESDVEK